MVGLLSLSAAFHLEANQTLGTVVFFLFLLTGDQVPHYLQIIYRLGHKLIEH